MDKIMWLLCCKIPCKIILGWNWENTHSWSAINLIKGNVKFNTKSKEEIIAEINFSKKHAQEVCSGANTLIELFTELTLLVLVIFFSCTGASLTQSWLAGTSEPLENTHLSLESISLSGVISFHWKLILQLLRPALLKHTSRSFGSSPFNNNHSMIIINKNFFH